MTDLLTRGQLDMLAQDLGESAESLESLTRLGANSIHALRTRISNLLFDAHTETFARVSKLAPIIPNALAAKVAQDAVPPEAAGRAGGVLGIDHPGRVAGLLACLAPAYMADAAAYLDPRAVAVLAPRMPGPVLIPAALELLRRRDYTTAARFLEHAPDRLIHEFERGIPDNAGLLRAVALTPTADRLDRIVRAIPDQRRQRIIASAATADAPTMLAGLSVLSRLQPDLTDALGAILFDRSLDHIDRIVTIAHQHGAHGELLAVLAAQPDSSLTRIAEVPALTAPGLSDALGRAAVTPRDHHTLAVLGSGLPHESAHRR